MKWRWRRTVVTALLIAAGFVGLGYLSNVVSAPGCEQDYLSHASKRSMVTWLDPMLIRDTVPVGKYGRLATMLTPWFFKHHTYEIIPTALSLPGPWGYRIVRTFRLPFIVQIDVGFIGRPSNHAVTGPVTSAKCKIGSGGYITYLCFFGYIIHSQVTYTWTT